MYTPEEISILQKAEMIIASKAKKEKISVTSTNIAENILKFRLAHLEREEFHVMYLNNQHEIIEILCETKGTINAASVYPREIVKNALKLNAAAVIISHNHPSGSLSPSTADFQITDKIRKCLDMLDIRTLDHIIVAGNSTYSFADNGQMS